MQAVEDLLLQAPLQGRLGLGQNDEVPEPKYRPKGGFHAIRATKSLPQQLRELDSLRKQGIVKTSPPLPAKDERGETPWATDAVELSPAQTLVCYQAALVHPPAHQGRRRTAAEDRLAAAQASE